MNLTSTSKCLKTAPASPTSGNRKDSGKVLRSLSDLCKKYQILAANWVRFSEISIGKFEHHESRAALISAAESRCGICVQFIRGFHKIRPRTEVDAVNELKNIGNMIILIIPYNKGDLDDQNDKWSEQEALCWEYSIQYHPAYERAVDEDSTEPMTSTMDALSLCKSWLQKCDDTHSKCNLPCTQTIPTRLIVLDNGSPRLIASENLYPGIQYATLSHCWGAMIFVTLTTSNIQQFQREIPEDLLPKTFREAIYICRYLCIQYLWIDSLCIIQDSTKDWDRESATMASVYGDAYLNIAATSAKDASMGCFFSRAPDWRCQVKINSLDGEEIYDFFHTGMLGFGKNPLGRRAWVVQERYLSRRTIHFSEHQVFWECNENPASEVFPSGYPRLFKRENVAAFVIDRNANLLNWPNIVDTYSRCALTKSSDKLIALAGLAKKIQEETNDIYITGMWRTNLEDQL